jgi:hypothetical protein
MDLMALALGLLSALPFAAGPQHFTLSASFVPPARAGATGTISVSFTPSDPEIHINQEPPPRLKLDPTQKVLVDKQPPAPSKIQPYDPETAKYVDTRLPVSFAVAWAPGAPKGPQSVRAVVVYFYCSKRDGWCRRGSAEIEVPVTVP